MALSMGFRVSVSLHPAIQATELLTFTLAGLTPTEHTSLSWTHNRDVPIRRPWMNLVQSEVHHQFALLFCSRSEQRDQAFQVLCQFDHVAVKVSPEGD